MRLLWDDNKLVTLLLHEDIALKDDLRTSRDNKGSLAFFLRGIAIADDADITVTEAKGGL